MRKFRNAEEKRAVIDALVANCSCQAAYGPWKNKDVVALNAMPDEQLMTMDECRRAMAEQTPTPAPPAPTGNQEGATLGGVAGKVIQVPKELAGPNGSRYVWNMETNKYDVIQGDPTVSLLNNSGINPPPPPQMPKTMTPEQWLAMMPEQMREVWNGAVQVFNQTKANLIEQLTANMEGDYKTRAVKHYNGMPIETLRDFVAAQPNRNEPHYHVPQVNYGGMASPPTTILATNEEPLVSPVYNDWSRPGSK